jgi:phosphopantothenoylcysteine decarboxylase/phosphopantothenate--cysteine ligase
MGYALAAALIDAGSSVTLVSGPTALQPPSEARVIQVETALQMAEAVTQEVDTADVLLMAAAVADYRPANIAEHKIKKQEGDLAIVMERTTDILASINRPDLLKVGFAAETRDLLDAARGKLDRKHLDLIIANEVSSTMGSDESQAYFLEPGREPVPLSSMRKASLADLIVERIADLLDAQSIKRGTI